jgi:hypothetical protein
MLDYVVSTWGLLISIAIYFLFFYKSRVVRFLEKIPRPPHYPIVGNIPSLLRVEKHEILDKLGEFAEEYGSAFTFGSIFGHTVVLNESSSAEVCSKYILFSYSSTSKTLSKITRIVDFFFQKLLTSQTNITKGSDYEYVRPWLGDGLLLSTGSV